MTVYYSTTISTLKMYETYIKSRKDFQVSGDLMLESKAARRNDPIGGAILFSQIFDLCLGVGLLLSSSSSGIAYLTCSIRVS